MAMTRRSSSTVSLTRRVARRIAFGAERLGQNQVDPVAGEDQAGVAGGFVDRHRDRAHARLQHGGEKAALAGFDHAARGQWLTDGERAPDDGANELCLVALPADQIGFGHGNVGPVLPAHRVRLHEGADRQIGRSDQHCLTQHRLRGGGHRERIPPLEPGAGGEGGRAGDQQGDERQEQATHGGPFRLRLGEEEADEPAAAESDRHAVGK